MPRSFEWCPGALVAGWLCLAVGSTAWAQAPVDPACPLFPPDAVFNLRIDDAAKFPVHPSSQAWIDLIGPSRRLHADFGPNDDPRRVRDYYGIPYNVVSLPAQREAWPQVSFDIVDARAGANQDDGRGVPDESDCAVLADGAVALARGCDRVPSAERRFPFSDTLKAEHGLCDDPRTCGDRHILVLERNACRLWESYFSYKVDGQWHSYSTAAWDLKSLALRPSGWTSTDAAGLPILPLLARADEASAGAIPHALRITFRRAVLDKRFVWPARHAAGRRVVGGIPFGALMRLRADFEIPAHWTVQARALALAMRRHGLYVADIGSDGYVQGDPNARWTAATVAQFQSIPLEAFEFVDTRRVTNDPRFDPNSLRGQW